MSEANSTPPDCSAVLCFNCGTPGRSDEMRYSPDAAGYVCDGCSLSIEEDAKDMYEQFRKKLAVVKEARRAAETL